MGHYGLRQHSSGKIRGLSFGRMTAMLSGSLGRSLRAACWVFGVVEYGVKRGRGIGIRTHKNEGIPQKIRGAADSELRGDASERDRELRSPIRLALFRSSALGRWRGARGGATRAIVAPTR